MTAALQMIRIRDSYSAIRILTILIILALRLSVPWEIYSAVFLAFVFAHYTLAATSTNRAQLKFLISKPKGRLLIGTALAVVVALVVFGRSGLSNAEFELSVVYFGLHHVLSDIFTVNQGLFSRFGKAPFSLTVSRGVFNAAVYVFLLSSISPFTEVPRSVLSFALAASFVWILIYVVRNRIEIGSLSALDILVFETSWLLFALATQFSWAHDIPGLRLRDIIFYHVMYWFLFILRKNWVVSRRKGMDFFLDNVILSGVFFILSPAIPVFGLSIEFWVIASNIVGYFHITTSFIGSRFNPAMIVNHTFQPLPSYESVGKRS